MTIAVTHATKRKTKSGSISEVAFAMPDMPDMPEDSGYGTVLTPEAQFALGYRIMISQIGMLKAMCVHSDVVSMLLREIQDVLDSNQPVGQALALIQVGEKWVRADAIPTLEFKAIAQRKLDAIRTVLAEVTSHREGMSDLFTMALRAEMATKMAEILPYDLILFKAAELFKARCKDLEGSRRKLVGLLSSELKLPRPKVKLILGEAWISPGLFSTLSTSVYELGLYPPAAKKSLRDSVIAAQREIREIVVSGSSNPGDLMEAWSAFNKSDRVLKESVTLMFERNQALVDVLVRQYRHVGDESQLRSAGEMGLLRAIYRYAPEMGFRFSTIGTQWIKQMIIREMQQLDLVRLPESAQGNLFAIRAVLTEQPNASKESIADITGLSVEDVSNLLYFVGGTGGVSLDSTYQEAGSSEADGLHESLADTNSNFVDELVEEDGVAFIERVLAEVLPPRHLDVVLNQFGIGRPEKTLKEIGVLLGISLERARQIREEAIGMLKASGYCEDLLELHV